MLPEDVEMILIVFVNDEIPVFGGLKNSPYSSQDLVSDVLQTWWVKFDVRLELVTNFVIWSIFVIILIFVFLVVPIFLVFLLTKSFINVLI